MDRAGRRVGVTMVGVDELVRLAQERRLLAAQGADALRTEAARKGSDPDAVLGLMERFHGVSAADAADLRRDLGLEVRVPAGRLLGARKAVAAATPPVIAAAPPPAGAGAAAADDGEDEDGGDVAVVVLPIGAEEPTRAQVAALCAATGTTEYEAKLRLREPLPRLLGVGPPAELVARADALCAGGVQAVAFESRLILGPLEPFRVKAVKLVDGRLHLTGPRGELRVDLAKPVLLVAGRFDFKDRVDFGIIGQAQTSWLFGHLYAGGTSDPIELVECDLLDFEVLGAARSMIRRENFGKLLELIRAHAGVSFDDSLLKHAGRIKEGAFATGASGQVSSNLGTADILSRVVYHLWRTSSGHDAAALAASLEVVSLVDSPEAGAVPRGRPATAGVASPPRDAPAPRPGGSDAAPTRPSGRQPTPPQRAASGRTPAAPPAAGPAGATPGQHCSTCRATRSVTFTGRCLVCGQPTAGAPPARSSVPWPAIVVLGVLLVVLGGVFAMSRSHARRNAHRAPGFVADPDDIETPQIPTKLFAVVIVGTVVFVLRAAKRAAS